MAAMGQVRAIAADQPSRIAAIGRIITAMAVLSRFRERLVLGPIVRYLDGDDEVLAWTHASIPGTRAPGVLAVTRYHCVLHVASSAIPDITTPLPQLSGFKLNRRNPEVVRVRLVGEVEVDVELSLTHRVRSRSVGRVLSALTSHHIAAPQGFDPALTSPIPPMVRSARHHARRIWVTMLGIVVLMLSAVFASPFVPGPGALTAVAGIAILASEYEWARDLHVWAARQADRFMSWMKKGLRSRGKRRSSERDEAAAPGMRAPEGGVLDAQTPVHGSPVPATVTTARRSDPRQ